jgi:protein kinase C substrate 80K-H
MSQTKQKLKKGGADTNMGNFVSFDTEIVDDDVPADGKGLGKSEKPVMKYENEQH